MALSRYPREPPLGPAPAAEYRRSVGVFGNCAARCQAANGTAHTAELGFARAAAEYELREADRIER